MMNTQVVVEVMGMIVSLGVLFGGGTKNRGGR